MVTPFSDVIGHAGVLDVLNGDVDRPAHAYLFLGPAGVGKATVARRFAAAVLCGDDQGCIRRVMEGNHPDLELVEPDGRSALTVERAREAVSRAVRAPAEADRKVFLFEEAGSMNDEAANALLKTLEEPSATTVFILVAESEADLPATVASRSRVIVFGRVAEGEIGEGLVAIGVDEGQARRAAASSGGRPGLAMLLATRPEVARFRRAWLSVPGRVDGAPGTAVRLAGELASAADPLIEGLAEQHLVAVEHARSAGYDTKAIEERHDRERRRTLASLHRGGLEILASWYRDAAAAQFGGPVRNADVPGTELAGMSARSAVARAERVLDTIESLERNQRPELAFAALFADLGTSS
jgi:DNA polymerase III subunit delta'